MPLPTKENVAWESDDAKRLADFLESSTGQRALEIVAGMAPPLLDGSDVNKTLVASGAVKGYGEALRNLFSLLVVQPPQPKIRDAYPSLDDEAQWDGATPR